MNPDLFTLDQVLDEFSSRSSLVYFLDMKDAKAVSLTLETITQYDVEDRVIFGAVDRPINEEVQKQKSSSMPIWADRDTMMKFAGAYQHGQVNKNYPYEHDILGFFLEAHTRALLSKHLMNIIDEASKPLAVVDSLLDPPGVHKEMIELGVNIVVTDRPDTRRQTLDSYLNK